MTEKSKKPRGGYRAGAGRKRGHHPVTIAKAAVRSAKVHARERYLAEEGLNARRVLEEYVRLALVDIRSFFDEHGNLVPMGQWSRQMGATVASMEVVIKNAAAGDGVTDRIFKFKLWDKTKALEALAKHFGLLTEKIEHSGGLVIQHILGDEE